MNETVLLARAGPVATLTLNRPDALNVLDEAMVDALIPAAAEVAADPAIRVLVVRGAGKHFMAGGDIRTFARESSRPPDERQRSFQRLVERVHVAVETIARMPQPVVARVQGAVAGFGLSLMNACDLAVASDDAYFAAGYRQIGITPDGGGTWSLPRLVGQRRALGILLLGERFGAADALAMARHPRRAARRAGRRRGCARAGARRRPARRALRDEAPRARLVRSHAFRTAAGRSRELRTHVRHRRLRRGRRVVHREAPAALRPLRPRWAT